MYLLEALCISPPGRVIEVKARQRRRPFCLAAAKAHATDEMPAWTYTIEIFVSFFTIRLLNGLSLSLRGASLCCKRVCLVHHIVNFTLLMNKHLHCSLPASQSSGLPSLPAPRVEGNHMTSAIRAFSVAVQELAPLSLVALLLMLKVPSLHLAFLIPNAVTVLQGTRMWRSCCFGLFAIY